MRLARQKASLTQTEMQNASDDKEVKKLEQVATLLQEKANAALNELKVAVDDEVAAKTALENANVEALRAAYVIASDAKQQEMITRLQQMLEDDEQRMRKEAKRQLNALQDSNISRGISDQLERSQTRRRLFEKRKQESAAREWSDFILNSTAKDQRWTMDALVDAIAKIRTILSANKKSKGMLLKYLKDTQEQQDEGELSIDLIDALVGIITKSKGHLQLKWNDPSIATSLYDPNFLTTRWEQVRVQDLKTQLNALVKRIDPINHLTRTFNVDVQQRVTNLAKAYLNRAGQTFFNEADLHQVENVSTLKLLQYRLRLLLAEGKYMITHLNMDAANSENVTWIEEAKNVDDMLKKVDYDRLPSVQFAYFEIALKQRILQIKFQTNQTITRPSNLPTQPNVEDDQAFALFEATLDGLDNLLQMINIAVDLASRFPDVTEDNDNLIDAAKAALDGGFAKATTIYLSRLIILGKLKDTLYRVSQLDKNEGKLVQVRNELNDGMQTMLTTAWDADLSLQGGFEILVELVILLLNRKPDQFLSEYGNTNLLGELVIEKLDVLVLNRRMYEDERVGLSAMRNIRHDYLSQLLAYTKALEMEKRLPNDDWIWSFTEDENTDEGGEEDEEEDVKSFTYRTPE
jgi:hypothetical protein